MLPAGAPQQLLRRLFAPARHGPRLRNTFAIQFQLWFYFFPFLISSCHLYMFTVGLPHPKFEIYCCWSDVGLHFIILDIIYPEVIYLASCIIESTRQEPESKTSPEAAHLDVVVS